MTEARRQTLTKTVVDGLSCPPGRKDAIFFDGEVKGLALRVTAAGAKVFLFQYRAGPAVRRVRIGALGDITPAQARRRAQILLGRVTAGGDPVVEDERERVAAEAARKAARAEARDRSLTVAILITRWQSEQLGKRSASYARNAPGLLRANFGAWLQRAAKTITRSDAMDMLERIAASSGPASARNAYPRRRG